MSQQLANKRFSMDTLKPWLMWSLGAGFFLAEYFARVDPSVIVPQLMRSFNVNAAALGSLAAFFYYPYIVMQIPVGSLVDRFGLRRLLTAAATLCGLSSFLFASAHALWVAELARGLMGFSAAFAFVGALKIATLWFPPRRLGLLAGLTQGMGMLGAAIGQGLFAYIIEALGWRWTMSFIGTILIIIAILMLITIRDRGYYSSVEKQHENRQRKSELSIWRGLKIVGKNKHSWFNALYAGLIYAPTGTFAELWGPSFLHRTYHINPELSAIIVAMIFVGWAVGGPLMGRFSDMLGRRKPLMYVSGVMSMIILSVVLYVPHLTIPLLFILLFCYGLFNTGVGLAYAVAGELNPLSVSGVSIAITNMTSILLAAICQPIVGWLLDLHWSGRYVNKIPFYSSADFHFAMMGLPFIFILSIGILFFIKETHCRRDCE